jgi:hypothetical protein
MPHPATTPSGASFIDPADDFEVRICFHPGDDLPGNGGGCFHPSEASSVSPCFRPDDDEPAASAAAPGRPVSPCFRPDDGGVNSCFHPGQPPVNSCRHAGDDLVSDLHLTLTGVEERHLAALAVR